MTSLLHVSAASENRSRAADGAKSGSRLGLRQSASISTTTSWSALLQTDSTSGRTTDSNVHYVCAVDAAPTWQCGAPSPVHHLPLARGALVARWSAWSAWSACCCCCCLLRRYRCIVHSVRSISSRPVLSDKYSCAWRSHAGRRSLNCVDFSALSRTLCDFSRHSGLSLVPRHFTYPFHPPVNMIDATVVWRILATVLCCILRQLCEFSLLRHKVTPPL